MKNITIIININRLTEKDPRLQIYLVLRLLTQRLRIDTRTIEPNTVHLKVLKRKRTYTVRKIDPLVHPADSAVLRNKKTIFNYT